MVGGKKDRLSNLRDITNQFNKESDRTFSCITVTWVKPDTAGVLSKIRWWLGRRTSGKKRAVWCMERRHWTVDQHWKKFIFFDESQIVYPPITKQHDHKQIKIRNKLYFRKLRHCTPSSCVLYFNLTFLDIFCSH